MRPSELPRNFLCLRRNLVYRRLERCEKSRDWLRHGQSQELQLERGRGSSWQVCGMKAVCQVRIESNVKDEGQGTSELASLDLYVNKRVT